MKTRTHVNHLGRTLSLLSLLLVALWCVSHREDASSSALAQPPTAAEAQDAAQPAPATEFRGRLPNFFGNVVSPEQRDRIYAIQAEYAPRIDALERELSALLDARDTAVEGVLTAEQLQQVEEQREAARRQREERSAGGASTPAGSAAP
jgi:flagellar basal body-associated protein FliL